MIRPSVKLRCSAMECGSESQPAAWSFGTTNFLHVSASVAISQTAGEMFVHPISNRGTGKQNCRPQYLLWRGRENHFRREQRTPFAGGGVVVGRAPDEFDFAIQFFYEPGGSEGGDCFAGRLTKP